MISFTAIIPDITTDISPAIKKALYKSVAYVRKKATAKAPYMSGTLRRSLVEKVDWLKWTVWTNVVYARIHEYWWTIVPKRKKMLAFKVWWKRVFAKKVRIPKRPYMKPAMEESRAKIRSFFEKEIGLSFNVK